MPRDKNGFLKPDALKQGLRDQYGLEIDGVTHLVEIVWDHWFYHGYAVRHERNDADGNRISTEAWMFFDDLRRAQHHFNTIVRDLRGRA